MGRRSTKSYKIDFEEWHIQLRIHKQYEFRKNKSCKIRQTCSTAWNLRRSAWRPQSPRSHRNQSQLNVKASQVLSKRSGRPLSKTDSKPCWPRWARQILGCYSPAASASGSALGSITKNKPGYLNARIQKRRDSQQGCRPWIYNLWKSHASSVGFDECKIPKTWQEILDEIDAEENLEDANEKAQAIGSTPCTTDWKL